MTGAAFQQTPSRSEFTADGVGVEVSQKFLGVDTDQLLRQIVERESAADRGQATLQTVSQHPTISSAWIITSAFDGPRATIFGGVHGLESCGVEAVATLLGDLVSHRTVLKSGSVALAIGNEQAVSACQRQLVSNLNRLFRSDTVVDPARGSYETARAIQLMGLMRETDWFLDLHSTSAPTRPFAIVAPDDLDLAAILGYDTAMVESEEWLRGLFAGTSSQFVADLSTPERPRHSLTVENGQHADPLSVIAAARAAHRFLAAAGVIEGSAERLEEVLRVTPFKVIPKERDDFRFLKGYANFDELGAGEYFGEDGAKLFLSPRACRILLPTPPQQSPVGIEVCLLGDAEMVRPTHRPRNVAA